MLRCGLTCLHGYIKGLFRIISQILFNPLELSSDTRLVEKLIASDPFANPKYFMKPDVTLSKFYQKQIIKTLVAKSFDVSLKE